MSLATRFSSWALLSCCLFAQLIAEEAAPAIMATAPSHQEDVLTVPQPKLGKGRLEVITGCMFAGKTEELMRRLRRHECAHRRVITVKHTFDNRVDVNCIDSHAGKMRLALAADSAATLQTLVDSAHPEVVAIEEVQFFPTEVLQTILDLVDTGKIVIVSGLDTDFRGEPFGIMPTLLVQADDVSKLSAICVCCGRDARFTQRIINGRPAKYADPIIMVGAEEAYEARCRDCFCIDKPSRT